MLHLMRAGDPGKKREERMTLKNVLMFLELYNESDFLLVIFLLHECYLERKQTHV